MKKDVTNATLKGLLQQSEFGLKVVKLIRE
jgi:hypothetical protein